jgi:hypothetical protein
MNIFDSRITNRFTQSLWVNIEFVADDMDEYAKDPNLLGGDLKRIVYVDTHAFSYWIYPANSYVYNSSKLTQ